MTRRDDAPLHLNAFLMSVGHHEAAWRLPESPLHRETQVDHYISLAQTAERGKFDSIFFADSPQLYTDIGRRPAGGLEPLTLLSAIAVHTERIGLIATASTSYNSPYNLARRFASIDHISRGRAGWNIVTTAGPNAARNFGLEDQPSHRERYERAAEFLQVAQALWQGWEPEAVLADKATGIWGDNSKVHPADHHGRFYSVAGPLNVQRTPQVYPLLVQAGSSEDGKNLAAQYAEAIFTAHQRIEDAVAFYDDVKARAARHGRDPHQVKVLPGIVPIIGATESEARSKEVQLNRLIRPEYALQQLTQTLRLEPGELSLDQPLPEYLPDEDEIEGSKSRYSLIVSLARRENLTVRELIGRLGGGRGHFTFAGTPEQVADVIEQWFTHGAADGFNIMPPALPSGLEEFVDTVVPILQERGLFRSDYTATTLRGHYGLPVPPFTRPQELSRPRAALAIESTREGH
ncbi:LLM class flavin-dependent oxidoreductase [Nesterenkonia alba]|uniref:LLM class flavin-dependent oxidoreductase n=1 Tax=Nesterenkonia alba TaxID=515814 RepID=UPI0003B488E1|nr:LLM class flavin-dependent oxidoreductase [Nesterenkonia alba]